MSLKKMLIGMLILLQIVITGCNPPSDLEDGISLDSISLSKKELAKHIIPFRALMIGNRIYGTGFYLNFRGKTFIVTNRHICTAGQRLSTGLLGMLMGVKNVSIQANDTVNKIIHIDNRFDICILETDRTEGLELSPIGYRPLDKITLIGFPRGVGKIIREGRIVNDEKICIRYRRMNLLNILKRSNKIALKPLTEVVTYVEKAPKKKKRVSPYIVKCVDSTRISALAYGGNSGSPILNERGQVIGILYAGSNAYPHEPFIVKYEQLVQVLIEHAK